MGLIGIATITHSREAGRGGRSGRCLSWICAFSLLCLARLFVPPSCSSWRCHCHHRGEGAIAAGLICRFSVLSVLRATCRLPTTTYYYGSHCVIPHKPCRSLPSRSPISLTVTPSPSPLSLIFVRQFSVFYFRAGSVCCRRGASLSALCALKATCPINNFMKVLNWQISCRYSSY